MQASHTAAFAAILTAGTGALLLPATPAISQAAGGPVARYTMDASTQSGMGGGAAGALAMMGGGSNSQTVRTLDLRLGSSRAATGAAKADHFMPQGARLGVSVPLTTPRAERNASANYGGGGGGEMPKGRMLLFWGCGEHAPAGQPLVIDFAKMAKGQAPSAFAQNIGEEWQIASSNSRTYGEWPNQDDNKVVPNNSSLLGAHKIVSSYAPEIGFSLADDFMPALSTRSATLPSGAYKLDWNAIGKATGYYAYAMGSGGNGSNDMVWWSSSTTQHFGGALTSWLSPAAVAKLVAAKTVMPAAQTSCTIPAEVRKAGGDILMTQLFAYGPQAEFSYPARPANAKAWKPEWTARVRFRSNASVMLGMDMGDGGNGNGSASGGSDTAPAKPKCKKGLAGIAQRAAGLC